LVAVCLVVDLPWVPAPAPVAAVEATSVPAAGAVGLPPVAPPLVAAPVPVVPTVPPVLERLVVEVPWVTFSSDEAELRLLRPEFSGVLVLPDGVLLGVPVETGFSVVLETALTGAVGVTVPVAAGVVASGELVRLKFPDVAGVVDDGSAVGTALV